MEEIYKMQPFEELTIKDCKVVRVPGGWTINGTFVPMNNEFLEKKKKEVDEFYPKGYLGVDFIIPKKHGSSTPLRYAVYIYYQSHPHVGPVCKKFLEYWESRDKSGKYAFESQKSFSLPGRLATFLQSNTPTEIPQKKKTEL